MSKQARDTFALIGCLRLLAAIQRKPSRRSRKARRA